MIKPIVYHTIEEKEALEKVLISDISDKKRKFASKALMNIFFRPGKKHLVKKSPNQQ